MFHNSVTDQLYAVFLLTNKNGKCCGIREIKHFQDMLLEKRNPLRGCNNNSA